MKKHLFGSEYLFKPKCPLPLGYKLVTILSFSLFSEHIVAVVAL